MQNDCSYLKIFTISFSADWTQDCCYESRVSKAVTILSQSPSPHAHLHFRIINDIQVEKGGKSTTECHNNDPREDLWQPRIG